MQVFFCDRCTRRVTERELADDEGLRFGDLVFCRFCLEEPEVREDLAQAAAVEAARVSKTGFHRAVRPACAGEPHADRDRGDASLSGRRCGERRTPRHGHRHAKTRTPPHGRRATSRRPATPGGPDVAARRARPPRPASPVPSGPATESVGSPVDGGRDPHRDLHRLRRHDSEQESSGGWLLYGSIGMAIGFVIGAALKWLA